MLKFSRKMPASEQDQVINKLPKRDDFIDKTLRDSVQQVIDSRDTLLFLPNYVMETQQGNYRQGEHRLVLYGILPDGRKSALVVTGIKPFFDVKVPPGKSFHEMDDNIRRSLKQLNLDIDTEEVLLR